MSVAAPLLTRRSTLQVAMETTYGSPASVGSTDALLVENADYSVNVTELKRNFYRGDMSPMASIAGRKEASLKFKTEFRGSGIQNSGSLSDVPLITRLFRACGYASTAHATVTATSVYALGTHTDNVSWAVSTSGSTHTDVIYYELEVTTGGASGTAQITVTSDTAGEGNSAATVTTATPLTVGSHGITVTPTFTGSLVLHTKWCLWALPTGVSLTPVSTGFESVTLVLNKDGVKHSMPGAFGTFSVNAEAGNYATIEWEFKGIFVDAVDAALPSCSYESALPHQVELARLRVDGDYVIVQTMTYAQTNDIQIRPDVSSSEGYVGTRIVSRDPEGGINPEAELVADHDFWGKLSAASRMPFQMRIGTAVGNTVWMLAPSTQYTGLTYQDRNGILTYDAKLKFSRIAGNDEVMFYFS